jgi:hypothetical protein
MAETNVCVLLVEASMYVHTTEHGRNVMIVVPDQSVFTVFTQEIVAVVVEIDFANILSGYLVVLNVIQTHIVVMGNANGHVFHVHLN